MGRHRGDVATGKRKGAKNKSLLFFNSFFGLQWFLSFFFFFFFFVLGHDLGSNLAGLNGPWEKKKKKPRLVNESGSGRGSGPSMKKLDPLPFLTSTHSSYGFGIGNEIFWAQHLTFICFGSASSAL